MNQLTELWTRLSEVQVLQFKSQSQSHTNWGGAGTGVVKVSVPTPDVLLFEESGSWNQDGGKEIRFTNVFRWSIIEDKIKLEHLRFGVDSPVFLFDMELEDDGVWREIIPHPCNQDCYRASLQVKNGSIHVRWLVQGPNRDELIYYVYV